MLKMYLVNNCYNLSGPQPQDMLNENMAVQNYVCITGYAPDETILWKISKLLEEKGVTEQIFNHLNKILKTKSCLKKAQSSTLRSPKCIQSKTKTNSLIPT